MKRRDFSTGLLAAGLATSPVLGPTNVLANPKREERQRSVEQFVRMQLRLTTGVVLVTWVLLMFPTILGLNYQRTIPRYPLQRANLGVLLLGLQRPPFDKRFQSSLLLGSVVLWSSMLLILPALQLRARPRKIIVANEEHEYAHPGRPRSVSIRGLPPMSQLRQLPTIGTARINDDNEIGLFIPPLKTNLKF